jgi:metal-responsive CopG/Arc/MetJ family transcriptional regulator
MQTRAVTLTEELNKQLTRRAKTEMVSVSAIVRQALKMYFNAMQSRSREERGDGLG